MAMHTDDQSHSPSRSSKDAAASSSKKSMTWFEVPAPVKRIFDKYPLVTYGANDLPLRAPRTRERHVLHVFTTDQDSKTGRPSFNPSCLKWQTYLKIAGIPFTTTASNNHASPSGALPFLIPAEPQSAAIPSSKLRKWSRTASAATSVEEPDDARYEAYASLLEDSVRKAWLYQLYLHPANAPLLHALYIAPCSSNPFVQLTLAHSLRHAAATELVKASAGATTLVERDTLRDAHDAFAALAARLDADTWFFAARRPSLFDASVFAYTFLILRDDAGGNDNSGLAWRANPLREVLRGFANLVEHARRMEGLYYT